MTMQFFTSLVLSILIYQCGMSQIINSEANVVTEQIMFTSTRDGNYEVYLMNADSTNVKNLTNHPNTDYGLNWSPEGKYILFYSNRTGDEEIWRMNADGSGAVNLTNSPASERSASYSPDGKTIVFTSDRDNKTKDLYLMDSDGTNIRRLTYNRKYCESPECTNDGEKIIFTLLVQIDSTDKNFNGELFTIDVDGQNQTRLTTKEGFDSGADISPDGSKIAFYGRSDIGFMDIWVMNLDGSKILNLTDDETEDYSPSWSADGNWISFTSGNSQNYDIWKMNIYTKEKIRLTTRLKRDETPYFRPNKNR